jgi:CTP synthase (UTP-ammonia lyase)
MRHARVALVGERDLAKRAHAGIEASLELYRRDVDPHLDYDWVPTGSIAPESLPAVLHEATAIWCVPGSPYESTSGALQAIRQARTAGKAFLGTCGGFQHALMEYARNVLGREAEHEEMTPTANDPLIVKLSCSLAGVTGKVIATGPGDFASLLGAEESVEEFNCNYGFNEELADIFQGSELTFVAHDESGQVRAFRLNGHPFFVGTLFQPERRALVGSLHPVVRAFLSAA